jgi:hypothetical protein
MHDGQSVGQLSEQTFEVELHSHSMQIKILMGLSNIGRISSIVDNISHPNLGRTGRPYVSSIFFLIRRPYIFYTARTLGVGKRHARLLLPDVLLGSSGLNANLSARQ